MELIKEITRKDRSVEGVAKAFDKILLDLPPRIFYVELYYVLNTFKFGTIFAMFVLMYYFQNFSNGAFLYAALHGAYGFAWISKHFLFPDLTWNNKVPLGTNIVGTVLLAAYWMAGYLIISGQAVQDPSPARACLSVCLVSFGCGMVISADAHKNFTLQFKKGLISDGWSSRTRNPNYLAEMLIYAGFAVLTGRWEPWIVLAISWTILFGERMLIKELSLMKKAGWDRYSVKSGVLLPKVSTNNFINLVFYAIFGLISYYLYSLYSK